MEENKSDKTIDKLYEYIVKEYKENGKFTATNRQLGKIFSRTPITIQRNIRSLQEKGLIDSKIVVEDSGYVVRYITPKNVD